MNLYRKIIPTLFALFVAATAAAGQQENKRAEEAVRQVLQASSDALIREDADVLDQIYSPEWIFINASGTVLSRAQRLSGLRSGELKYDSVETDQLNIRIYGKTAIATSRSLIKAQNRGQDFSGTYRVITVLVKEKKGWQIVVQQSTTIPQRTQ